MTKYHINSKGEPGKCKANFDGCPYGGSEKHYESPEKAYAAIEQEMGGSFNPIKNSAIKIRRWDKESVARESTNEEELMTIAEHVSDSHFNKKIVKALASNPSISASALLEARSKSELAWNHFVDLEMHPNYPTASLTNAGATRLLDTNPKRAQELLQTDDVNDNLVNVASIYDRDNPGVFNVEKALANPNNQISDYVRSRLAIENQSYLEAAARSGKFPTSDDLNSRYHVVPDQKIISAAAYSPSEKILKSIFSKYKNTSLNTAVFDQIYKNDSVSQEFKESIAALPSRK